MDTFGTHLTDDYFRSAIRDAIAVIEDSKAVCDAVDSLDDVSGSWESFLALRDVVWANEAMTCRMVELTEIRTNTQEPLPHHVIAELYGLVLTAREKADHFKSVGC